MGYGIVLALLIIGSTWGQSGLAAKVVVSHGPDFWLTAGGSFQGRNEEGETSRRAEEFLVAADDPSPGPVKPTDLEAETAPEGASALEEEDSFSDLDFRLFGGLLTTPLLPFRHHTPKYEIERQISRSGSLWASDKKVRQSLDGIDGGLMVSLSPFWSLWGALKYRIPFKDNLQVDYDPADPGKYAKMTTKTSSYGWSMGGLYKAFATETFEIGLSGGLDFDRSVVSVNVASMGADSQDQVASLSSKLMVSSLKLGGVLMVPLDLFGLECYTHLLLPFHELRQVSQSRHQLRPDVSNLQRQNSPDDLEDALKHKRASFGLEIGIRASYGI